MTVVTNLVLPSLAMLGLAAFGACVLPPSLTVGAEDAAVNSPPAITSVRVDGQELPPPGPVSFAVADTPTMTVDVTDSDLGDTLYVRAFVDYCEPIGGNPGNELDARSKCVAPPAAVNPTAQRSTQCDLRSLCVASDVTSTNPCDPLNKTAGEHDLSIVVFDREPLDSGEPAFQALPPGGLSTSVAYHLFCTNN